MTAACDPRGQQGSRGRCCPVSLAWEEDRIGWGAGPFWNTQKFGPEDLNRRKGEIRFWIHGAGFLAGALWDCFGSGSPVNGGGNPTGRPQEGV